MRHLSAIGSIGVWHGIILCGAICAWTHWVDVGVLVDHGLLHVRLTVIMICVLDRAGVVDDLDGKLGSARGLFRRARGGR